MKAKNPKKEPAKKQASPSKAETNPDACKKCGQVHPRCTGHKRRKNPDDPLVMCMRYPSKMSGTRKCKFCGGETPKGAASPHFVHGKKSKYQYAPKETAKRVEELAGDAIKNLEDNINIQKAFESQLFEMMGTGEGPNAWHQIVLIINKMDPFDLPQMIGDIARLKIIANYAKDDETLRGRIIGLHESQRKLTETLTKCRKDMQETFTMAQWDELLILVLSIIRNNVDRPTLTRIQNAFIAAGGGANGDQSGAPKLIEAG